MTLRSALSCRIPAAFTHAAGHLAAMPMGWLAWRRGVAWNAEIRRHTRSVDTLADKADPAVLSIVIPARDSGAYLEYCLTSILAQRMPDGISVEILIGIDNCAETRAAAERYVAGLRHADAGLIRTIFFPRHLGPYVIRNTLLKISRGELVQLVDADDAMAPEALARVWDYALDCRACRDDFIIRHMAQPCDDAMRPILRKKPVQAMGVLCFPKHVLEQLGGFSPWPCSADADFLRRAESIRVPVYTIPAVTYLYRQHDQQLTRSRTSGMKTEFRAYYARLIQRRQEERMVREVPRVAHDLACG